MFGDRYIRQVKQLPEAINHIYLLRLAFRRHTNRVGQWHHIVGMMHVYTTPIGSQLLGNPFHLWAIGRSLITDQNCDIRRHHIRSTTAQRLIKGFDHVLLARTDQRIRMHARIETVQKCCQPDATRHRVDLGQRKTIIGHQ